MESPKSSVLHRSSTTAALSPHGGREPIQMAFHALRQLGFTKGVQPDKDHHGEVLCNPESQFEKIIQRANEYLMEAHQAIFRLKDSKTTDSDLFDAETQVEKTIAEVSKIAMQLRYYVDETSYRRETDNIVSPRVVTAIKAREASVSELFKAIKDTRKEMEIALTVRERKDLLSEWSPFDRTTRRRNRDAEEITSDSTERLLNSKRILMETVQANSGTLSSLATSSQAIQKNDQELQTQGYMVSTARSLLKKYGRRASTDKLLIWLAFTFFVFCVILVTYRRLF